MGAIVPTLTSLTTAIAAVDTLTNRVKNFSNDPREDALVAQQRLALRQLQQQQAAQQRDEAEQAALSREKIGLEAVSAERQRLSALRRAVARQRAAFSGGGLETGDGSAEAVLLGLFQESDADRGERERLDGLRNRVIGQGLETGQRLNVLQLSQLRERQKLERIAEGF